MTFHCSIRTGLLMIALLNTVNTIALEDEEEDTPNIQDTSLQSDFGCDCDEILKSSANRPLSGVYTIQPPGTEDPFDVYCDFDTDDNGWTLIQRRADGSVNFDLGWADYKAGFGDLKTEFWLGNEKIFSMTKTKRYQLRIDLTNRYGDVYYARYSYFSIRGEDYYYLLDVSGYSGNSFDAFSDHDGEYFSTKDADRDSISSNCAATNDGGWWYHDCGDARLNSAYQTTNLYWKGLAGYTSLLKFTEMKIREVDTPEPDAATDPIDSLDPNFSRDCAGIQERSTTKPLSGVYKIQPVNAAAPFQVYCDFDTDDGGWTVVQRRTAGSTDFTQTWAVYQDGFGDLRSEFWLGNRNIYYLTRQTRYELRIELTNKYGHPYYAKYTHFSVGSPSNYYKLSIGTYSGNSGYDAMSNHDDMYFSTKDADRDESSGNCATSNYAGWWYNACRFANLNGIGNHAYWYGLNGYISALDFSEMKIRPVY